MTRRRLARLILTPLMAAILGLSLALCGGVLKNISFATQPAIAQSLRPEGIAAIVYQRLTYLPKDNQYVRQETGQVDADNTLVSRFIRYHQDIKKRPAQFRLDWRLTLADYLGVNEEIQDDRYPGKSTLTINPMEADIKAIRSLNRRQRSELVDILLSVYNPPPETPPSTSPKPQPSPSPSPSPTRTKPPLSKPGDSQLLMP